MSDFTLGVVNVWGGECLGGERLTIEQNRLEMKTKRADIVSSIKE